MKETPIDDLRDTLNHAQLCHEAWWMIIGENPQRDNIVTFYNRYKSLWGAIQPALFVSFVAKLASAFDKRSDCISLKVLTDHAQHPKFDDIWRRGRILYHFRNKVIAHRDLQVTERDFAAETGFSYDDLRDLLVDTRSVFDFCASRASFEPTRQLSCVSDFELMIHEFTVAIQA